MSRLLSQMNLLQVKHVSVQKLPTSFLASPRSGLLHLLAGLEFPIATPSFLSHACFSLVQVRANFLQLGFSSMTEGNLSIQPEHRNGCLNRP